MEPIAETSYWKQRIVDAFLRGEIHRSIFECSVDYWKEIEIKARENLARFIEDTDSILDAGCGWGRLLTMLPVT